MFERIFKFNITKLQVISTTLSQTKQYVKDKKMLITKAPTEKTPTHNAMLQFKHPLRLLITKRFNTSIDTDKKEKSDV